MNERDESYLSSPGGGEGFSDGHISPSRNCALPLEQKIMVSMKDVRKMFTRAVQLMLDLCAALLAIVKASLLLLEELQFVGSEVDMFCFGELLTRVVDMFARQVLDESSNKYWDKAVQDAANVLVLPLDRISPQRIITLWPKGAMRVHSST